MIGWAASHLVTHMGGDGRSRPSPPEGLAPRRQRRRPNIFRQIARASPAHCQAIGRSLALVARSPGNLRDVPRWVGSWRFATALRAGVPWLPFPAVRHLAAQLSRDARVFEYGAGGSTLWLAVRVAKVVSVEHSPGWYGRVSDALEARGVDTCELLLRPPSTGPGTRVTHGQKDDSDPYAAYIAAIDAFPDGYFDLVVVDGRNRAPCLGRSVPKIRPGGLLVLDDADRPAYAAAVATLPPWPRRDFRGLRPCRGSDPSLTVIWTRPSAAPA